MLTLTPAARELASGFAGPSMQLASDEDMRDWMLAMREIEPRHPFTKAQSENYARRYEELGVVS